MTPEVSILLPVYNDAAYVTAALESILLQSFTDLEVVASDDGSTDNSVAIIRSFADRDARVRLVTQPRNLGMTRNWNAALQLARGKYLMKLDADDAFGERTAEELLVAKCRNPQSLAVFCRTIPCNENLVPAGPYRGEKAFLANDIDPLQDKCAEGYFWYQMSFDDCQLWHSNAFLIERERLVRLGGWDERWGCAADTDLILRVLERNEPVVHVAYPGVLYRQRRGSVSDKHRRSGELGREAANVHLSSLDRYKKGGGRVKLRLARNWGRIWDNWQDSKYSDSAGITESSDVQGVVPPPPPLVSAYYRLYTFGSEIKRAGRG